MRTDPGRYHPQQWHEALRSRPAERPQTLTVPADWVLDAPEGRRLAQTGFWGRVQVLRLTGVTTGKQLELLLRDCPAVHTLHLHGLTDFKGFGPAQVRTLILDDTSNLGRVPTVESLTTRKFSWAQFPNLSELEFRGDVDLREIAAAGLARLAAETVRGGSTVGSLKALQADALKVEGDLASLFPALESLECDAAPVGFLVGSIGALTNVDVPLEVLDAASGTLETAGGQLLRLGLRGEFGAAAAIAACPNLVAVSVDGAAMSDQTVAALGSLRSLESLTLSDVELPDEAPLTLSPTLESLRCGDSWLGTLVLTGAGLREAVFDDCRLPDDWFDEQLSRWAGPQTIKVGLRDCDTPPTVKFGQYAPNVRHLILNGVGPSTVSGLEATLETLELRDSPAAADWIASHDWPRLQTLSLPGTANFSDLEVWLEARRAPLLNVLECDVVDPEAVYRHLASDVSQMLGTLRTGRLDRERLAKLEQSRWPPVTAF